VQKHLTNVFSKFLGGGLASEGEMIDVVEMTIPEIRKFIEQDSVPSPGGFLFGVMWFLTNRAPKA